MEFCAFSVFVSIPWQLDVDEAWPSDSIGHFVFAKKRPVAGGHVMANTYFMDVDMKTPLTRLNKPLEVFRYSLW